MEQWSYLLSPSLPSSDKLLLFFTVGYSLYSDINFNDFIASNDVLISVYRTISQAEDSIGNSLLQALVQQPGGVSTVLTAEDLRRELFQTVFTCR